MSYLSSLRAEAAQKHADERPSKGSKGAFEAFDGSLRCQFRGTEPKLAEGLMWLRDMPPPRVSRPDLWPTIVADALRLARDGWAARALALGWTELDLFGAVTDGDGDPAADGLAVKLAGRKVLAISDKFATVQDGENGRAYLYRRGSEGARLLWELRRGNTVSGRIPH